MFLVLPPIEIQCSALLTDHVLGSSKSECLLSLLLAAAEFVPGHGGGLEKADLDHASTRGQTITCLFNLNLENHWQCLRTTSIFRQILELDCVPEPEADWALSNSIDDDAHEPCHFPSRSPVATPDITTRAGS